jgi:glycosyltransferase involved in cell wall biosynthesis
VVEATAAAFAEKLKALLSDAALRQQMGQCAGWLVGERYTWATVAEQLEELYLSLLP